MVNKAQTQAHDQDPRGEGSRQSEELGNDDQPLRHDESDSGIEEEPEVSELALPVVNLKGKEENEKTTAASGWDILAAKGTPVLMDDDPNSTDASHAPVHIAHNTDSEYPRKRVWNPGETSSNPVKAHKRVEREEATLIEETCFVVPDADSPKGEEPYVFAPGEEHLPEDVFPIGEAVSQEEPVVKEKVTDEVMLEASQGKPVIDGLDDIEAYILNSDNNILHG